MIKRNVKVGIIHPWMPQYRSAFFTGLRLALIEDGVDLHVFYGQTPPEWKSRNDSIDLPNTTMLRTRFFKLGHRVLGYKSLNPVKSAGPYRLLILEQAIRNIETYQILVSRRLFQDYAYWGHGRTYTVAKNSFEERVKAWLTTKASWFFGYTENGVLGVVEAGFDPKRTTVVQNSIDSESFSKLLETTTDDEVSKFKQNYDLTDSTILYIGGLDQAKRIPFLLDASRYVYSRNKDFRLLLLGSGALSEEIELQAKDEPWLKPLGPVFGKQKAIAFSASRLLAIPGRVGLVAVDSLVSGTPIITTAWPFHAPEFEYLKHGYTAIVTNDDIRDYCDALELALSPSSTLPELAENCLSEAEAYTMQNMVTRFRRGILQALNMDVADH